MAPEFSAISTSFQDGILVAKLNRPTKANALDHTLWFELEDLAKMGGYNARVPSVSVIPQKVSISARVSTSR